MAERVGPLVPVSVLLLLGFVVLRELVRTILLVSVLLLLFGITSLLFTVGDAAHLLPCCDRFGLVWITCWLLLLVLRASFISPHVALSMTVLALVCTFFLFSFSSSISNFLFFDSNLLMPSVFNLLSTTSLTFTFLFLGSSTLFLTLFTLVSSTFSSDFFLATFHVFSLVLFFIAGCQGST